MQFVKGMDISMTKELEDHGAIYRLHGKETDIFRILQTCGTDMIRLRLWNDPYDTNGEPYGGGQNDLATTIELCERTKNNGMEILLDFHYSDFWADPAKQVKPKAWKNLTGDTLVNAVHHYTTKVLMALKERGLAPAMIQIGNEITKGLLWDEGHVDHTAQMASLLSAGLSSAREICPDAKLILHLDAGTDREMYQSWFQSIEPFELDFDMIGMSYYPHWNGSLDKLLENMNEVSQAYKKDVLITETSIGYTTKTFGCKGTVYGKEEEIKTGYPATEEGQERFLRELCQTVRAVQDGHGAGFFYWEPGWLPIPDCVWGSPAGCLYMGDSVEAGNAMANQTLFDAAGNANRALLALHTM